MKKIIQILEACTKLSISIHGFNLEKKWHEKDYSDIGSLYKIVNLPIDNKVLNRWQAIIWTNNNPFHWYMYVSSGLHSLNSCYSNYVLDIDIAINVFHRMCLKYLNFNKWRPF